MNDSIRVRVLAFGSAAAAFGWGSKEYDLAAGHTLKELVTQLGSECPRLAAAGERIRYAVNQSYATDETVLQDGDEIAVIPPVSGGAMPAARLVREPIDVAELLREVENPSAGGIALFVGTVRYETDGAGRALKALDYSAYDAMALAEMSRLCDDAGKRYGLVKALLVHRLGLLKIGDVSVASVVSAAHRGEAFDACRFIVEELKKSVPIFKKDIWQDGRGQWRDAL